MASETGQTTGIKAETTRLVQWAGIVGFVGQIIWWVVSTVLGVLWPDYNAVNDPVSLLAAVGSPHAGVQQLGFYVFGASIIVFCLVAARICSSLSRSLTGFREIDGELDAVWRYEEQTIADTAM